MAINIMKRDEHMIIGLIIGTLAGVLGSNFSEYFNFILYLLFVGLTVLGSITPDQIEPPRGENHRQFFHSVIVLGILMILLLWLNIGSQSALTYLTTGFILGYLSHLLLDTTSRMGLPKY
jgi:inner membrane protein